jgi:hypothetical protein
VKTVSDHVHEYMKSRPFELRLIRRGVINYRALARHMRPEISKRKGEMVSIESIAIVLQRIHQTDKHIPTHPIGSLRGVHIISDLCGITFSVSPRLHEIVENIFRVYSRTNDHFIAFSRGQFEAMFIVDERIKDNVIAILGHQGVVIHDQLGAISTRQINDKSSLGTISYPLGVLSENSIPIETVIATTSEILVITKEIHLDNAAIALRSAIKGAP